MNLLNGVLHFGFTILFKNIGKKNKNKIKLSKEKLRRKKKLPYYNNICRCKRDSFLVKLKLQRSSFYLKKYVKKYIFLKKLINLIQTNRQINMISDHSVSTNNSFKTWSQEME